MKLSQHKSASYKKLVFIGDSGTGKTGALVSLVKAGFKLKILDLDSGLDALVQWTKKECPELIDNIDAETVRDRIVSGPNGPIVTPTAFVQATKLMSKWTDGSEPSKGGENEVFVIDSLTALGRAAFEWAKGQNPASKDPRQWYFAAQQALENLIGMLTSPGFESNLIVISHINYRELEENVTKGYPSAIGSAMGPTIPKYFNTMIQAEIRGSGRTAARKIKTVPSPVVDLKNPAPFKLEAEYDLGTGLAKLFADLDKI